MVTQGRSLGKMRITLREKRESTLWQDAIIIFSRLHAALLPRHHSHLFTHIADAATDDVGCKQLGFSGDDIRML